MSFWTCETCNDDRPAHEQNENCCACGDCLCLGCTYECSECTATFCTKHIVVIRHGGHMATHECQACFAEKQAGGKEAA